MFDGQQVYSSYLHCYLLQWRFDYGGGGGGGGGTERRAGQKLLQTKSQIRDGANGKNSDAGNGEESSPRR